MIDKESRQDFLDTTKISTVRVNYKYKLMQEKCSSTLQFKKILNEIIDISENVQKDLNNISELIKESMNRDSEVKLLLTQAERDAKENLIKFIEESCKDYIPFCLRNLNDFIKITKKKEELISDILSSPITDIVSVKGIDEMNEMAKLGYLVANNYFDLEGNIKSFSVINGFSKDLFARDYLQNSEYLMYCKGCNPGKQINFIHEKFDQIQENRNSPLLDINYDKVISSS
jgi:hypothetical protein